MVTRSKWQNDRVCIKQNKSTTQPPAYCFTLNISLSAIEIETAILGIVFVFVFASVCVRCSKHSTPVDETTWFQLDKWTLLLAVFHSFFLSFPLSLASLFECFNFWNRMNTVPSIDWHHCKRTYGMKKNEFFYLNEWANELESTNWTKFFEMNWVSNEKKNQPREINR